MNKKEYWLISTSGMENKLWFRDDEDFKVGMNYIPIVASLIDVIIMAFILMSNHVHFVVYCTKQQALAFIERYKKQYSQYYGQKYEKCRLLKRNGVQIDLLPEDEEAREKAIAYVLMNSVDANLCLNCYDYKWGSAACYFSNADLEKGRRIDSMSQNEQRRITHSKMPLYPHWRVGDDGYILPSSYVDSQTVESLFKTPKRMNYFLTHSSKAKKTLASEAYGIPSFRDQTIIASLPDLCQAVFGKADMKNISEKETRELAKQIRYRFSSDAHQIARVLNKKLEEVTLLLDCY